MKKTVLLFSGQGAQTVGMGRDLFERYPTASRLFKEADSILGLDLSKVIFEGPEEKLTQTEYAQPAIFLMSWVAMKLLQESIPGFEFQGAAGLSLGEFTALAAAEVFSFEEGLILVRKRGTYMQEACDATQGGMAAIIGLPEKEVREICAETGIELANLNCPGQIVISGESSRVVSACELARAKGAKRALPLAVAGAYHSSLMRSAQSKLKYALKEVKITVPMPHEKNADVIRDTLVRQVTSSVLFESSLRWLIDNGFTRFVEVGPGTVLCGFLKRISKEVEILNIADTVSLEKTVAILNQVN